jgi:hypothetical protein
VWVCAGARARERFDMNKISMLSAAAAVAMAGVASAGIFD